MSVANNIILFFQILCNKGKITWQPTLVSIVILFITYNPGVSKNIFRDAGFVEIGIF